MLLIAFCAHPCWLGANCRHQKEGGTRQKVPKHGRRTEAIGRWHAKFSRMQGKIKGMGNSRADKAQSHGRIVALAAARFREAGVNGIGVADLMKGAGLTHGGFYRHFASRDELVAEAVELALRDGGQAMQALESSTQPPEALLALLVDRYLSAAHRDQLATSCAVTTLVGDVAHSNDRARSAYTAQVESYLGLLIRLAGTDRIKARRIKAIAALATLVGAVSMARAVNDEALSREILDSAAEALKAQFKA